jgi:L-seryl-tRNA(Ser) seleniumtransferase
MAEPPSGLRALPRVDDILNDPKLAEVGPVPRALARQAARDALEEVRERLLAGEEGVAADGATVADRAAEILRRRSTRTLRRVINATGVVLHTGLGRAPLPAAAREALAEVAAGFCNVQADLDTGERVPRERNVEWLFREITGAEAALVVNNNAAATVLVLNTLGAGREVIVSRGEMVEIGGAFRIPDILKLSGCRLVEVGCTNRTHLRDYESALTGETALILSVHQSNFRIVGFASQTPVDELAQLAHSKGVPLVHDLGSGALVDLRRFGLPHEPDVKESFAQGADVVLFSGDKLVGGPQCGIILGKKELLASMRRNPFYRAFRVCKLTLAALEGTLRLFLEPERLPETHGMMSMLTAPPERLRERAEGLAREIRSRFGPALSAAVREDLSQVGGGSLAGYELPTAVVRLESSSFSPDLLAQRLRLSDPPIFARIREEAVLLDLRTVFPEDESLLLDALGRLGEPA